MSAHRWFEYGERISDVRVEAVIRTTYETDPHESEVQTPDVRRGTIEIDALELLQEDEEIAENMRPDGRVLLSGLSSDAEERLLDTFERDAWDRVEELVRDHGCSKAVAVDYVAVEERGMSQSEWARRVDGLGQPNVSESIDKAEKSIRD